MFFISLGGSSIHYKIVLNVSFFQLTLNITNESPKSVGSILNTCWPHSHLGALPWFRPASPPAWVRQPSPKLVSPPVILDFSIERVVFLEHKSDHISPQFKYFCWDKARTPPQHSCIQDPSQTDLAHLYNCISCPLPTHTLTCDLETSGRPPPQPGMCHKHLLPPRDSSPGWLSVLQQDVTQVY